MAVLAVTVFQEVAVVVHTALGHQHKMEEMAVRVW
jgi:hypothetical protein